jgi:hypothetical protein
MFTNVFTKTATSSPRFIKPFSYNSVNYYHYTITFMKKLSLLLTSLVGAAGGYLLSNKKLRKELQQTKNVQEGLTKVVSHLKKDGKSLGDELQAAINTDAIQEPIANAKKFVTDQFDGAKDAISETYDSLAPKKKISKPKTIAKKTTKKSKTS